MNKYWMVGMGGFLGSIARFWVSTYVTGRMGPRWPYGTFVVNMTGCFLIGLAVALLADRIRTTSGLWYLFPVGFIGAYTTFSAFELELFQSLRAGEFLLASMNLVLSVVVGLAAVALGLLAGRAIL